MKLPIKLLIIFLLSLFFTATPVSSQFNFFHEYCRNFVGNYTIGSAYQDNINILLPNLTNKSSLSTFNTHTVGEGIDQIYGLYMCRGDLSVEQCHDCIKTASLSIVEKCPVQKEAIVWYQECMVRYANRSIFSLEEEGPMVYIWNKLNVSDSLEFGKIIKETVDGLITQAAYNASSRGYAVGEANVTIFEQVYALAQCTPDILGSRCERCLREAFKNMGACCGTARLSLTMYFPSCWLRYAHEPIVESFDPVTDISPPAISSPSDPAGGTPNLDFGDPLPPPSTDRSIGTTSTLGIMNYMFGLVMTLIVSFCMAQ